MPIKSFLRSCDKNVDLSGFRTHRRNGKRGRWRRGKAGTPAFYFSFFPGKKGGNEKVEKVDRNLLVVLWQLRNLRGIDLYFILCVSFL